MKIRDAGSGDIELLTRLNIQLREDEQIDNVMTDEEILERMKTRLAAGHNAYLFEDDEGSVLGYALVETGKKIFYLCQLFICRECRDRGIGTQAFRMLVEHLNVKELDVEVLVWNERAIRYYERLGFRRRYLGLRWKKEE